MSHSIVRAWSRLVLPAVVFFATIFSLSPAVSAQNVEKVADLRNVVTGGTYVSGSRAPYDNAIQIGNQLWFTTNNGGINDAGTVSYYDLATHTVTAYVSMDTASGNTPQSSLTQIGNTLYFTTTRGGTGDTGTISSVPLGQSSPTITALYNFGAATTTTNPRNPGGNLTAVGNDLYFTTPNGGTGGTAYGTVSKYNTVTGTTSTVYNFTSTSTANGRQPMEGFTSVGGKLYFTTFTGGSNAGTGYANGSGTLSMLDPSTGNVSTVASMPAGNGLFPSHNVTQAANGLLYFSTVGNATNPGSIQSFNLATGTLSTVYALTSAATSSGPFPDGRFAYGSVVELNNVLYFATMQGGTYNRGTIDAFDLGTNQFTKLADLDGGTTENLTYLGQNPRGGMTVVNENGTNYLYLLTNAGGLYGNGTVLRITPLAVPEPGTVALFTLSWVVCLLWRRGKRAAIPGRATIPPAGRDRRAFTLVELLVTMGIVVVLASIIMPVYSAAVARGREAACLSNLRQIGAAYYSYAQDHNNYFPSAEALGYSNYRQIDDPLGLPMLLAPYLGGEYNQAGKEQGTKVWLCPSGRRTLKAYGNNYAWSRSTDVTSKPVTAIDSPKNTILAWDNYPWTLPSVYNVPEPTAIGGPRTASTQYQYFPHRSRSKLKTDVNWLYADGHVATQFNDGK